MESSCKSNIFPIKSVPGLFISDGLSANSTSELSSLNIRHILFISRPQDVPKFKFPDSTANSRHYFVTNQIDICDTSTEDILCHLKNACDWIELNLQPKRVTESGDTLKSYGVLIHCPNGIRRAGTCVVAFLMRNCSLSYSAALLLARESHHLISPNPGFELQLRIWGHCNYDVIEPSRKAGKPVSEGKAAYKAWEKYRDELLGRNVNDPVAKAHFSMVAKLAANFGKQKAIRAYHDVAED